MKTILPLGRPAPDGRFWVDTLMGRLKAPVPPLVEYLVDDAVQQPIVTGLLGRRWVPGWIATVRGWFGRPVAAPGGVPSAGDR